MGATVGDDLERWFVVLDSELHGPISRRQLAELLAMHPHDDDTPIWSAAHTEEWTTLRETAGIAGEAATLRAADAIKRRGAPPPLPVPASPSDPSPIAPPSTSGQVDIGAALRALSEKRPPPLRSLDRPRVTPPSPPASPARPRSDWAWLATGVALTAVAFPLYFAPTASAPGESPVGTTDVALVTREAPSEPTEARLAVAGPPVTAIETPEALAAVDPATGAEWVDVRAPIVEERPSEAGRSHEDVTDERDERRHAREEEAEEEEEEEIAEERTTELVAWEETEIESDGEGESVVEGEGVSESESEGEGEGEGESDVDQPAPVREAVADARERSFDDLISAALPSERAPEREDAEAAPTDRIVPTDAEVVRALDAVRESVAACTPAHAVAALRLTIDGSSGRVNSVYVDGVFAGTPVGSCIARGVRRARVTPFSQPTFTFSYPFRL